MADKFQNAETERLATEVAELANQTRDEAVQQSLRERRDRLTRERPRKHRSAEEMRRFMETEIWPRIPAEDRGKPPLTKAEIEEILGYGPEGV